MFQWVLEIFLSGIGKYSNFLKIIFQITWRRWRCRNGPWRWTNRRKNGKINRNRLNLLKYTFRFDFWDIVLISNLMEVFKNTSRKVVISLILKMLCIFIFLGINIQGFFLCVSNSLPSDLCCKIVGGEVMGWGWFSGQALPLLFNANLTLF